jgi:hypothetical protein
MQTRLLLTLSFGFVLSITSAYAQKPIRTVSISGGGQSNDFEQNVVSALQARLNATARYEITTETAAELNISFSCIDMQKVAGNINGGACSFLIVSQSLERRSQLFRHSHTRRRGAREETSAGSLCHVHCFCRVGDGEFSLAAWVFWVVS